MARVAEKQPGFKKKDKHNKYQNQNDNTAIELFRWVVIHMGKESPELYGKAIERLGLYISTQFKNGSD